MEHLSAPPTVAILYDADLPSPLDEAATTQTCSLSEIPHLPASGGVLRASTMDGASVVTLPQPTHLYDGASARTVTFPVRMLATAGLDALLLVGTAAPAAPSVDLGDVMLLTDHINFQAQNPLVGPNVADWGPRFPDMTTPYAPSLRRVAEERAHDTGLPLRKGVYLARLGPEGETSAERRMAQRLGADAVGAGLVPEVLAARHMAVPVLALALLEPAAAPAAPDARSRLRRFLRELPAPIASPPALS
jgi:purine-nucleoside phosphorylase